MLVIPAIDIQNGKAVRLTKGVMTSPIVYSDDPLLVAEQFKGAGIHRLHLVDLDGAKTGATVNLSIIEKIAKLDMQVEVGGGIRDMAAAKRIFSAGASYIIVGTAAVNNKGFVLELAESCPQKIILGIDARGGFAATDGWSALAKVKATDLALEYKGAAIESVIYTDIERDGVLSGINIGALAAFADASPFKVIASGGVSCRKDIDDIIALDRPDIFGVIVGKALYEKRVSLSEIVAVNE
jgi:phosphoribosylformimino-5-aminoimidazole carboxamide ribotide isomerase